ncbi:Pyruvate carboxyltransferase [Senna tora]|uniref:Pyruvate carboxyltransferase n=1 Tax=Senna tora TaxID=362788 RepID=A0A835CH70_9FABA|nr:Pyruvate carboxyltransferase [Senna tora]
MVNEVSVWVQLWDVPLEYQTPLVAHRIGYLLGAVREVDWIPVFPRNLRLMMGNEYGCNVALSVFIAFAVHVVELGVSLISVIGLMSKLIWRLMLNVNGYNIDALDPAWINQVEKYCPAPTHIRHPLPGIRINEPIFREPSQTNELKWVEYGDGEFGLANGWPADDSYSTVASSNAKQKQPMIAEDQPTWRDILEDVQPLQHIHMPGSTFEVGQSSRNPPSTDRNEEYEHEQMVGGTITPTILAPEELEVIENAAPLQIFLSERHSEDQEQSHIPQRPQSPINHFTKENEDMNYHLLRDQNSDPIVNHVHPPQISMALTWQDFLEQSFSTAPNSLQNGDDAKTEARSSIYLSLEDNEGVLRKRKACTL